MARESQATSSFIREEIEASLRGYSDEATARKAFVDIADMGIETAGVALRGSQDIFQAPGVKARVARIWYRLTGDDPTVDTNDYQRAHDLALDMFRLQKSLSDDDPNYTSIELGAVTARRFYDNLQRVSPQQPEPISALVEARKWKIIGNVQDRAIKRGSFQKTIINLLS
jgi:hypothetical protein